MSFGAIDSVPVPIGTMGLSMVPATEDFHEPWVVV